jgi:hypothetical protein
MNANFAPTIRTIGRNHKPKRLVLKLKHRIAKWRRLSTAPCE